MEAIKNTNSDSQHTASSSIQSAIDELSSFAPTTTATATATTTTIATDNDNDNDKATSTNTVSSPTTSQKNALSQIDSTLSSLNVTDAFPYSSEHRARPHSASVSPSNQSHSSDLARSLGRFASQNTHHSSLTNLYSPALSHWNNVGAIRNPYATYGAHRSAAKSVSTTKDSNNPRKKTYEDKMDKQRLEHILFSGDNSGPLNQVRTFSSVSSFSFSF